MNAMLPKEHPEMPDFYGVKIFYREGGFDKFKVATHKYMSDVAMLELRTHDNQFRTIPFGTIKKIEFDKQFSKLVEIREEQMRDEAEAKKKPSKKRGR